MGKMTISFVKGRGSINHNNREFFTPNVDQDRTPDNIIYIQQPLDQAYDELFGEEVERYNQGKKPCRQIQNYMEHIRQSKNGEKLFYENVVQVGNMQDMKDPQNREKAIKILDQYAKDFQKHNPNLHVFNMVMHLDEASPHLHIDYIPIARGYKQGLQVRNSLDKALKQQGIDGKANKKENSTHFWQEQQKDTIELIMRDHGIERTAEKGLSRAHMTDAQYKAVAEIIHNEVREMPKKIETAPMMFNKERVTVAIDDLEKLEKRARLSLEHEKATKQIEKGIKEREKRAVTFTNEQMEKAKKLYKSAENEQMQAHELRTEYERMLEEQKGLQPQLEQLQEQVYRLEAVNDILSRENSGLKDEVKDQADQIEKLKSAKTELLQTICNTLMYIKERFKNEKLGEICDALIKYINKKSDEKVAASSELPLEVKQLIPREEKREGIKEYPLIAQYKGGVHGQGFYSGKVFLGDKSIKAELERNGVKISDPYNLLKKDR